MTTIIQKVAVSTIKAARRCVGDSPVRNWDLTSRIKRRIFFLAFPELECEVEYLGARIVAPTRDISIVPALVGGFYERLELEIFRSLCARSRTVLDVGSNIGIHAAIGGRVLPEGGRIHCFEPVGANLRYLERNLARDDVLRKATVVRAAVGDQDGELKIYLSKNSGTHSASRANAQGDGDFEIVPQLALDSYVAAKSITDVDLVKVDVEGFDGHVLRGAKQLMAAQRPAFFVEYIPRLLARCGFDHRDFIELISGYRHRYMINVTEERGVPISMTDLYSLARSDGNANLILADRPEQRRIIEEHILG